MTIFEPDTYVDFLKLIDNNSICVVDFFATWCKPCKCLSKDLSNAENNELKGVCIIKINVDNDEFQKFCEECGIAGIPHVIFFKNKVLQQTIIQGYNMKQIIETVNKLKL